MRSRTFSFKLFFIWIQLGLQISISRFGRVNTRGLFLVLSHKWFWSAVVWSVTREAWGCSRGCKFDFRIPQLAQIYHKNGKIARNRGWVSSSAVTNVVCTSVYDSWQKNMVAVCSIFVRTDLAFPRTRVLIHCFFFTVRKATLQWTESYGRTGDMGW